MFTNNKTKEGIDYFIAGSGIKANRVTDAQTALKTHHELGYLILLLKPDEGFARKIKESMFIRVNSLPLIETLVNIAFVIFEMEF